MKLLRTIIVISLYFFLLNLSLYSEDGWPIKLDDVVYDRNGVETTLDNICDVDLIKKRFNHGYKGIRGDDSPIDPEFQKTIKKQLKKKLNDKLRQACDELKSCGIFNELFGDKLKENLDLLPKKIKFWGKSSSIDTDYVCIKDAYLLGFIRNIGKAFRKGENVIDLPPNVFEEFYEDPIHAAIGHELMHALTDFVTGQGSECIVHCLTKKCLDKDWDMKDAEYSTGSGSSDFLNCHQLTENNWQRIHNKAENDNIGEAMNKGDCFCDVKWTDADCNEEEEKPEPKRGDTPDDNYSHSSGIYSMYSLLASMSAFPMSPDQEFFSYSYYPDVLIYDKFNYPDLPGLLDNYEGIGNIDDYEHGSFSNNHRLLIVPSGEFMGDENSEIIKQAIKLFVESGGTLLVLSQQYDTHIENLVPVPEGESLKFYGWRQDQSCYSGSIYFNNMHPVLSSSTGELLSGAVDGYFETWPSTSTVLLNRTKNREAAMLYYPYGNGTVILTSLYTDWGYAHSQATPMELRVVRDLITFAKNPHLPIPMYDLTENFYPVIDLNVKVKNSAETLAAKVILKAYTPDRKRILHQMEQTVSLAPGEEVEVPVQSPSSLVPRPSSLLPPSSSVSSVCSVGSINF